MTGSLDSIVSAVRATSQFTSSAHLQSRHQPTPFITIARQAGSGAWTLAQRLAQRLNETNPGDRPWAAYDRELVQTIASDLKLSASLIEAVDQTNHNWLTTLVDGLTFHGPTELKIFNRMAATIYGLAQAGRSIIVGRGGVFITRNLPGGIHVYLIAPEEYRVQRMAQQWHVSPNEALRRIREIELARQSFYRHYFPRHPLTLDVFTITINVASVPEERLVDMLLPMIPRVHHK